MSGTPFSSGGGVKRRPGTSHYAPHTGRQRRGSATSSQIMGAPSRRDSAESALYGAGDSQLDEVGDGHWHHCSPKKKQRLGKQACAGDYLPSLLGVLCR
jgi:hypothetical protein